MKRRDFIIESGLITSGALILSWGAGKIENIALASDTLKNDVSKFSPNQYIAIGTDGVVTLVSHRSEMGQGTRTSTIMLLADELEVEWKSINVIQADGDIRYGDQNTDGSKSITLNWTSLREAGAAAREMLIQAAAKKWGISVQSCFAKNGAVQDKNSKKILKYSELVNEASKFSVPMKPILKPDSEFQYVGKPHSVLDLDAMIAGKAVYGIDVLVDDLHYAVLERAPTISGKIKSLDDSLALQVPGVISVHKIEGDQKFTNDSVAVVAKNTWAAIAGRKALKIEWSHKEVFNSSKLRENLFKALDESGKVFRSEGDYKKVEKNSFKKIERKYYTPHLVHATMEPPACIAHVKSDSCEIWAPSQDPYNSKLVVAKLLGMNESKIQMHVTLIGGGFGRKSQPDFILEAALISKKIGKPVKLTWTREDEMQHGFYHGASAQVLRATLDENNKINGWNHHSAMTTITKLFNAKSNEVGEFEMGMGASNLPYNIPNILCEGTAVPTQVRVAWMRSVCNIFHSFSVNSFLDEIAHETKRDPIQMCLDLLEPYGILEWDKKSPTPLDRGRLAHVIKVVSEKSNWHKKRSKGIALGFACHYSFKSYIATVLEVQIIKNQIHILSADVVIDCGKIVNPESVKAQMEGSVVFGLSAALMGEISFQDGIVDQTNFHQYKVVRMPESPKNIRVHLVKSDAPPTGVGEPGVPPIAPALFNAIFALTGKRLRELPLANQLG